MAEPIRMTAGELRELLEYSCSLPTGTKIGKTWKRNNAAYGRRPPGTPPDWWMGEYVEDPDPELVGIVWRKIIVMEPYRAPNRFVGWLARVGLFTPPKMVAAP